MWKPKEALIWLREISLDPLGGLGVLLATLGGGLFFFFVLLSLLGFFPASPYLGIFIYLGLPAVLLVGLTLLPFAHFRLAKRRTGGRLPAFDFENPKHLRRLGVFAGLTAVNLVIFSLAGYGAYHVSETNEFCGKVCHTVMKPEWTAYQLSPHARVKCVECHIGPGADWFVRSKLSGARQVLAVATGRYQKPVPTPIHNLRPARETCEQCHWPEKFHGDALRVLHHFQPDSANTPETTVLLLKVRGGERSGEEAGHRGIHWHTKRSNRVTYVATDERREKIPYVRLERDGEAPIEFFAGEPETVRAAIVGRDERVMDCMDCHNRPTHSFELPDDAVEHALATGRLDPSIPYLRREAERVLRADLDTGADPVAAIRAKLDDFYAKDPSVAGVVAASTLDAVASELATIRGRNVFPEMNISWGTYPVFLGHKNDEGGCFRCHDGEHATADGRYIENDCETCHSIIAEEEPNPAILSTLYP